MVAPTVASRRPLSHTVRLPSTSSSVRKALSRLSSSSLVTLALDWLNDDNLRYCEPVTVEGRNARREKRHIRRKRGFDRMNTDDDGAETEADYDDDNLDEDDEDEGGFMISSRGSADILEQDIAPYDTAVNVQEVKAVYASLESRVAGVGKKEVLDRILEGDWRSGLTLYQLAMAETRFVIENHQSIRWHSLQFERMARPGGPNGSGAKPPGQGRSQPTTTTDPEARTTTTATTAGGSSGGKGTSLGSLGHDGGSTARTHDPILSSHAALGGVNPQLAIRTSSFLSSLHARLSALVRAHYYVVWHPNGRPVSVLRIHARESPYATERAARDSRATISSGGSNTAAGKGTETSHDNSWKTVFFVFPDDTPFLYVGVMAGSTGGSLRLSEGHTAAADSSVNTPLMKLLIDAIPNALSRPHKRLQLRSTALSVRSLDTMLGMRGPGRGGGGQAGGVWNQFTHNISTPSDGMDGSHQGRFDSLFEWRRGETTKTGSFGSSNSPASANSPFISDLFQSTSHSRDATATSEESKRNANLATARFGSSSEKKEGTTASIGIDRFEVCIQDSVSRRAGKKRLENSNDDVDDDYQAENGDSGRVTRRDARLDTCPSVILSFRGSDLFAGIRELVAVGAVNGESMPGWMTGLDSVSRATVRDGRVVNGYV